uniref:Cullin domain-containing protein n=1 Tax=Trichobilharzia regenti TaxID=157069 RepID=A0AA85K374_TRIRE|nr:unnamed protein product [Trichobilharzia regenti]
MNRRHCLILAFVWTLLQLSYVVCNEISPAERSEMDKLIKKYSELYGRYKTAECVAFLTVRLPEINLTVEDFNSVTRDTKYQIFVNTSVDYLKKLKDESTWKNVNEVSDLYREYTEYLKDIDDYYNSTVFENIGAKMRNRNVRINLTEVFTDLVNSLRDAWTARKNLYTTAAVYYKTDNIPKNHDITDANEQFSVEDWGQFIEKEFIKSREKFEQKCQGMPGTRLGINAAKKLLKKSDWKKRPKSEFEHAVVQLISEVEKVEKQRIERLPTLTGMDIMNTVLDAMAHERDHEFGE